METKLYEELKDVFIKIDGSWIRVSSVEAIEPTARGRARVYLSSGNFIDASSASGSITPDDVMQHIVKAQTRP